MNNNIWGKVLRIVGIILMALTGLVTVISGIGLYCAAFTPEQYADTFSAIIPYKWLYQIFFVITVGVGIAALWATYGLIRGRTWSYKATIGSLAAIVIFATIHIITSRALRGKSMPNDLRLYIALFTLIVFLLFRIPRIWNLINTPSATSGSGRVATGAAAFVCGLITLTTPLWAVSDHMYNGFNLVNVLQVPLYVGGSALVLGGLWLIAAPSKMVMPQSKPAPVR